MLIIILFVLFATQASSAATRIPSARWAAQCSDMLYTGATWPTQTGKGIRVGAYTDGELLFIGNAEVTNEFTCTSNTSSLHIATTQLMRAMLGPPIGTATTIPTTEPYACCSNFNGQRSAVCDAPGDTTSITTLCRQLGYTGGTFVAATSTTSCPDVSVVNGQWSSNFVSGTHTEAKEITCTTTPAKCAAIAYTGSIMTNTQGYGVKLDTYTNGKILFLGSEFPDYFTCTDDADSITFNISSSTMRTVLGPGTLPTNASYGCCTASGVQRQAICNSPDTQADVDELCGQLGYLYGTFTRANSNACPQAAFNSSSNDWFPDSVGGVGHSTMIRCSSAPTPAPTRAPTQQPTPTPTQQPTLAPTRAPTRVPTRAPTHAPTVSPTRSPTPAPTLVPAATCSAIDKTGVIWGGYTARGARLDAFTDGRLAYLGPESGTTTFSCSETPWSLTFGVSAGKMRALLGSTIPSTAPFVCGNSTYPTGILAAPLEQVSVDRLCTQLGFQWGARELQPAVEESCADVYAEPNGNWSSDFVKESVHLTTAITCYRNLKCSDLVFTGSVWGSGTTTKGVMLGAYTNYSLQFLGAYSSTNFECTDTKYSLTFGTTFGGTMHALLGPGPVPSSGELGCCSAAKPQLPCNSPTSPTDVQHLCVALGYTSGSFVADVGSSCPQAQLNNESSLWTSDYVVTSAYAKQITCTLSGVPTPAPTLAPTLSPTDSPTVSPTDAPTDSPTLSPTDAPTTSPTLAPTNAPTFSPTDAPTVAPTVSPTVAPTPSPTVTPGTPSRSPTTHPTDAPTQSPTRYPSPSPSTAPSRTPSQAPSQAPSQTPSASPSRAPSTSPSRAPTDAPTDAPTPSPTVTPGSPSRSPTEMPTQAPTRSPTRSPTHSPSHAPSTIPTPAPTNAPSALPTRAPTPAPTLPLDVGGSNFSSLSTTRLYIAAGLVALFVLLIGTLLFYHHRRRRRRQLDRTVKQQRRHDLEMMKRDSESAQSSFQVPAGVAHADYLNNNGGGQRHHSQPEDDDDGFDANPMFGVGYGRPPAPLPSAFVLQKSSSQDAVIGNQPGSQPGGGYDDRFDDPESIPPPPPPPAFEDGEESIMMLETNRMFGTSGLSDQLHPATSRHGRFFSDSDGPGSTRQVHAMSAEEQKRFTVTAHDREGADLDINETSDGGGRIQHRRMSGSRLVAHLPDGWARYEAENGIPYYHNEELNITQWDPPLY